MKTVRHRVADSTGHVLRQVPGGGGAFGRSAGAASTPTGGDVGLWSPALVFYAIGAVASAVKSTPISTFLMIFYNQVVGLPALSVSAIVMASLVCDAFFDPLIGQISDRWRSRLGRRLPLMYASALPLTAFVILLWTPPADWPSWALHLYLAMCLIGVRLFDTFFELPHLALVPEMTADYHRRTQIFTIRSMCESAAGMLISLLAYTVFMKQAPDGSGGILSPEGYPAFACLCGAIVFFAILISTAGIQRWSSRAPLQPGPAAIPGLALRDLLGVVRNRSLLALVGATILISIASGIGSTLGLYWMIYYYRFSQAEISVIAIPTMLGVLAVASTPALSRRIGKRNAAICLCWTYALVGALPMLVRTWGWVAPDSPLLFAIVLVQCFVGPAAIVMVMVALSSMIADLVEDTEVRTGQRSEALLLSSVSFARKLTMGAGTLGAGLILTTVSFPGDARPGAVPEAVLVTMAWLYLALKSALFLTATVILFGYRHTQAMHEDNLARLSARHSAGS